MQYRLISDTWSVNTAAWSICSDTILIENPEFIYVKTDAQERILWAIKSDGTIFYGAGVPLQVVEYINNKLADFSLDEIITFLNGIEEGDKTLQQLLDEKFDAEGLDKEALETQTVVNSSEFIQVTTDSDGKILSYRYSDGVVHENVGIKTPNIVVNDVDILDKIEQNDLNANSSIWESGDVSVSTGELSTNNKRIRCVDIKKHELSINATGGYMFSVYVYNRSKYIGCYGDAGSVSTENIKWWKSIDLTSLSDLHPEYSFNIVACRVDVNGTPIEDVITASEGNCIKMLTPFEMKLFEKDTFCPIISFIDDDFMFDAKDNWYNICAATGIRMGFAIPTASMNENDWEAIRRLQSDGFDFLSHTHHHINLMNETDPDVIRADLQASIDAFNNNGVKVNGLVYPQSSISQMALGILKQYFEYSFNGGVGIESIQGNPVRQHNITRTDTGGNSTDYTDPEDGITYHVTRMASLSTLKSYVDKAVNENCWVIFESHFRNSYKTGDGFSFTPEMHQEAVELIEYAISKGCKVVTPSEGYQILKNRLMRGTYGSNNYYIIDHNGFIYRRNM